MTANIWSESRRIGLGGKTGTATIFAFKQAKKAMVKSKEGGYTNTTLTNIEKVEKDVSGERDDLSHGQWRMKLDDPPYE